MSILIVSPYRPQVRRAHQTGSGPFDPEPPDRKDQDSR